MKPPLKMMMTIYVDETDLWETGPLYEAIVRRLRQLGVAGATVQSGIMGFGKRGQVHHKHLFGISDDKPMIITVVDSEATLRAVAPEIRSMVREGLVLLQDVEAVERAEE